MDVVKSEIKNALFNDMEGRKFRSKKKARKERKVVYLSKEENEVVQNDKFEKQDEDEITYLAERLGAGAVRRKEEISEKDIIFEEELQRYPYSVKVWMMYIRTKSNNLQEKFVLYERALKYLPCSYKIWWYYLEDLQLSVKSKSIVSYEYKRINCVYERCLLHNYRMPQIWLSFCSFLEKQKLITKTRRAYNSALISLPVTQHHLIWGNYIRFAEDSGCVLSTLKIYKRYLMLETNKVEKYVHFLLNDKVQKYDEAAVVLSKIANDQNFVSEEGKTNHEVWMWFFKTCSLYGRFIRSICVEKILRYGIKKFSDEVATLWCSLAEYFLAQGFVEKARDIFEEGLNDVMTVKDFTVIFDAYAAFEENIISFKLQQEEADEAELDMHIARLENLLERRKELLSSVKLRQNPHNVYEWIHRVSLFKEDNNKILETYASAASTIDPQKALGRLCQIWINFANFYEKHGDLDNSRHVLFRATQVDFKGIDNLASIWCEWIEMELRHQNYAKALQVARQSINKPRSDLVETSCRRKLFRSVKLWTICADIEESLGTHVTTVACYDKMISLKVITPQLLINYAHYLEEKNYFEESFKVYERGICIFHWPQLNDIWLMYLSKFVSRFGGKKLERARELFEQVLLDVPQKFARRFYILYAKLEENFGLARHALRIYHKATKVVEESHKLDLYRLYISKTADFLGITKTREIFEDAIENLPENMIEEISMEYADVERALGEIDRARAIYQHTAQFCFPSQHPNFWKVWREFEVLHGSEDTFRDMLRIKRSVVAQYSLIHFNSKDLLLNSGLGNVCDVPCTSKEDAVNNVIGANNAMMKSEMNILQENLEKQKLYKTTENELLKKKKQEEISAVKEAQKEYMQLLIGNNKSDESESKSIDFTSSKNEEEEKSERYDDVVGALGESVKEQKRSFGAKESEEEEEEQKRKKVKISVKEEHNIKEEEIDIDI